MKFDKIYRSIILELHYNLDNELYDNSVLLLKLKKILSPFYKVSEEDIVDILNFLDERTDQESGVVKRDIYQKLLNKLNGNEDLLETISNNGDEIVLFANTEKMKFIDFSNRYISFTRQNKQFKYTLDDIFNYAPHGKGKGEFLLSILYDNISVKTGRMKGDIVITSGKEDEPNDVCEVKAGDGRLNPDGIKIITYINHLRNKISDIKDYSNLLFYFYHIFEKNNTLYNILLQHEDILKLAFEKYLLMTDATTLVKAVREKDKVVFDKILVKRIILLYKLKNNWKYIILFDYDVKGKEVKGFYFSNGIDEKLWNDIITIKVYPTQTDNYNTDGIKAIMNFSSVK